MNKKGFTLVEILAVVLILGLLSGIATLSVNRILNNSRKKEAKKIEEEIAALGDTIYIHEKIKSGNGSVFVESYKNGNFYILVNDLRNSGYLEGDIKSPWGGTCSGYLEYTGDEFKGYIDCGAYKTEDYKTEDDMDPSSKKVFWNENNWSE